MDVDRVMRLDVAHQFEIPLERDVGVVPTLQEDLHPADRLALINLRTNLLEREDVSLAIASGRR